MFYEVANTLYTFVQWVLDRNIETFKHGLNMCMLTIKLYRVPLSYPDLSIGLFPPLSVAILI